MAKWQFGAGAKATTVVLGLLLAPVRADEPKSGDGIRLETSPALMSLYLPIPLAIPGVQAQTTGVFVPADYKAGKTVDLIVFLRGYDIQRPKTATSVSDYWNSPRHATLKHFMLREEINKSDKNVILAVPTLGPYSEAGKLNDDSGAKAFLNQILDGLWLKGPHAGMPNRPSLRHLILAAHSGGGVPLRRLAQIYGSDADVKNKLKACWGFDCLYGVKVKDAQFWADWAKDHPRSQLSMYYILTQKEVAKDPKLPVSPTNPLDRREPTGTTFPSMELERLAGAAGLSNVVVWRESKESTLSHVAVPRAHLATLLKSTPYLDER